MPRGGDQGGRRPRTWIHDSSKTKSINVPPAIKDQVMRAARLIDRGNPEILRILELLKPPTA